MSISIAHYSNIASKASVSHHFLCVQCARLAIMAMAGRNRTPQILRLATGLRYGKCCFQHGEITVKEEGVRHVVCNYC